MSKKVLIVDDSNIVIQSLKDILEGAGYEIIGTAMDGVEAISKCKELLPDIVTLDINMPKMDGLQTLRILRTINDEMKIVMVTSLSRLDKIVECKSAGASNYILKPFDKEKVLEVFSEL